MSRPLWAFFLGVNLESAFYEKSWRLWGDLVVVIVASIALYSSRKKV